MDATGEECVIVGSKPEVPVEGMERVLDRKVHWVDANKRQSWSGLGLKIPEIFFQSGWAYPAFSSLGAEVKAKGGKVVGLVDTNWRGDFRQLVLGPIAFRLLHRASFDAIIVAGQQGRKIMRWFGFPNSRVVEGLYGADPRVFSGGVQLNQRPKTFLFVGQFVARKGVLTLARALLRFNAVQPGWTLRICGSGEMRALIPSDEAIIVEDFVQPEELASRYRQSRFFVLPSLVEAWGLVVHEAALCGCALILSDTIGSIDDLSNSKNCISFKAGNEEELYRALMAASKLDETQLIEAEAASREYV